MTIHDQIQQYVDRRIEEAITPILSTLASITHMMCIAIDTRLQNNENQLRPDEIRLLECALTAIPNGWTLIQDWDVDTLIHHLNKELA